MYKERARSALRIFLPITLFALGCFPSRGLYFLLHSSQSDAHYHASQPVLSAPTSPTPKWKPAKVPLPARLSRMPRALKQNPLVPAPNLDRAGIPLSPQPFLRLVSVRPDLIIPKIRPASPPPGRSPPAAL